MVGVLISMKLAVLRRSMSAGRAASMVTGALIGLALAVGTIVLAVRIDPSPISSGLLSLVFLGWTLGWLLGPMLTGGDATLRLDYFTPLPVRPGRLAVGLFGASFVGVPPVMTLLGFLALVVYGARYGVVPALVAVPGAVLLLLFVVLISRVAVQLLGSAMKTRVGWELSALLLAFVIAFGNTWWFMLEFLGRVFGGQWASTVVSFVNALPSTWPVLAVEAAQRSDWLAVGEALLGLVVVCGLLLAVWALLLSRHMTRSSSGTKVKRPIVVGTARRRILPKNPAGAVVGKEMRLWVRDPRRARFLRIAMWVGLLIGLMPLVDGHTIMLPWAGLVTLVFAGAFSANVYGLDSTGLWLTLVTPGVIKADVRGRQLAWLLMVGPFTIAVTVVFTAISGQTWAWPWVLAAVPALLGAAAGLIPLVSLLAAAPFPDRRDSNPLDGFNDESADQVRMQIFSMLLLQIVTAAPAVLVVMLGMLRDNAPIQWAGVALGLVTGVLYWWGFGRLAAQRLHLRGSELLLLMRKGARAQAQAASASSASDPDAAKVDLPRGVVVVLTLLILLAPILLIPQGIVALILSLTGSNVRTWFAALYLPHAYQVPAAVAFILLGALGIWGIVSITVRNAKAQRLRREAVEEEKVPVEVA
ncbi:hypothetical protein [Microbispora sp. NPDC049125]|uniref:hypothetical protein n=1 Tax=Microbispora sp. NPDC049125 TaxID=3154929 RepID=UPI003466C6A4